MSEEQEVLLTAEGLKKLEEKLENLKTVRRKEVAARIKQAIDFGDLSENSEYDD
ncbi:MAG: transcription elongation factor GreA, partial [Clostridia bacterium]